MILAARKRLSPLDRHGKPKRMIPSGGGVVVVMSLIIGLLVADIHYAVVLSMFLLAAVSLLSDIIDVPAPVRWLIYILAVMIPVNLIPHPIFSDALPAWLDKSIMIALWVWCIHVFTAMDNIDGMTSTEMICVATGLSLIVSINGGFPNPLSVYGLIVMSVACGFFWWNWYPAKILLGEVGSAPVGFFIGYMLFMAMLSGYGYAAMILPAYYFCDVTFTCLRRILSRFMKKPVLSEPYYLLAVRGGRRHDSVVRYVFGLNFLLGLLATFSVLYPALKHELLVAAYICTLIILRFFAFTPCTKDEPF